MSLEKLITKFKNKSIITEDDHWLFPGYTGKNKYKVIYINGKQVYLHRYVFCVINNLSYFGDFIICHKRECNIPNCWNPEHLYKGDYSSNLKDTIALRYHFQASKSYCKFGHPLNGIRIRPEGKTSRYCKECLRISSAKIRKLKVKKRKG